ncbi:MAG TPA: hypothetical protein VF666_16730 [Pyrinomonadaceae bacterium]
MTVEKNGEGTYRSAGEIEALVRGFEDGSLAASEFNHREHLLVALWYLRQSPTLEAAGERMRAGLLRFLEHHKENPQIYHETITLFWLKRVRSFLDAHKSERSLVALCNAMFECCGTSRVINHYYSKELRATDEARSAWVNPDLQPLDF